jgi:hypothetical protein
MAVIKGKMRVETTKKGKRYGFRVCKGSKTIYNTKRTYPTQHEAQAVGKNRKEMIRVHMP